MAPEPHTLSEVDSFKAEIAAYRFQWGMTETTFGRKAMNNPHFVERLKNPTARTMDRVRKWMADNG